MLRHHFAFTVNRILLLACVITLSIPQHSLAQSYTDQQSLTDRMDRIERDLTQVQGQVYRGESSPAAGPRISGANSGSLEIRLSELEEQMRNLTGAVEKATFTATKVNERLDKMSADLDFRFNELEKKAGAAPLASPTADAEPAAKATKESKAAAKSESTPDSADSKKPKSLGTVSAKTLENAEKTDAAPKEQDEAKSGDNSAQDQYDYAFSLLRQSKFDEAEIALKKFIEDNGKNPLTGNAYYWLGEAYYAQNAYDKAAVQFLKGYKLYNKGSKAPDSLLKLGSSLAKLKKKKEACATFAKLSNEFPDASSSVAEKAQDEAARIGCK